MRPDGVEVFEPRDDDHPCLCPTAEPFHIQALVPEFAVESLVDASRPWHTRIDERHRDALICNALENGPRDELGDVVRADEIGTPRSDTSRDSTSMTCIERIAPATSIARPSRVKSSATVKLLSFCPLAQGSWAKSMAQT
jgi:hypothetical protein